MPANQTTYCRQAHSKHLGRLSEVHQLNPRPLLHVASRASSEARKRVALLVPELLCRAPGRDFGAARLSPSPDVILAAPSAANVRLNDYRYHLEIVTQRRLHVRSDQILHLGGVVLGALDEQAVVEHQH